MLFVVRHQADSKRLLVSARFFQGGINDLPADLIRGRLKFVPEPATVGDRRVGKIRSSRSIRLFRCRALFGPTESLIQRLTIEPLEGCDAHARIHEYLITLFGPYDDHLVLGKRGNTSNDSQ